MERKEACLSCKYGEFATHNEWGDKITAKFGVCRRFPPQTFSKATGYAEFNFPKVDKNDKGILLWKVTLNPSEKKSLYFEFEVEYPKDY